MVRKESQNFFFLVPQCLTLITKQQNIKPAHFVLQMVLENTVEKGEIPQSEQLLLSLSVFTRLVLRTCKNVMLVCLFRKGLIFSLEVLEAKDVEGYSVYP